VEKSEVSEALRKELDELRVDHLYPANDRLQNALSRVGMSLSQVGTVPDRQHISHGDCISATEVLVELGRIHDRFRNLLDRIRKI
jgi:hypothetical protein